MNLRWIGVVWVILLPHVLCIWRKNNGDRAASLPMSDDRRSSNLAQPVYEDMGVIAKKLNALKLYSERSDCFRDASSTLYSGCESLDFEPSERVKVAVGMTLCELATAEHASLPLECKDMHTLSSHRSVSQCVEALARSAQHWSSYSGYLREIPQLCTAYRRFNEIDHAKSIYANITSEKISFLSSLGNHYSELSRRQKELAGLTEGLDSIMRALGHYSSNLEDSVAAVPQRVDELAREIRATLVVLSQDILADTQALNSHAFENLENYLSSMLSEAQTSLSLATANTQTGIETAIRSLDAAALSWNSRLVVFNQRLKMTWEETFNRKLALEQAIDDMRDRVSQTDSQLQLQLATTQRLQMLSSETSLSLERTNSQLLYASNMLSQELETLASVTQELQTNVTRLPGLMFKFNSSWLPGIFSSLPSVWRGLQLPTWQAQLVMHVVGVGASGIQNSISSLFTVFCALLFLLTHIFRYVSYFVGYLLLRVSRGERPAQSHKSLHTLSTGRVHRRAQVNRSRLASVLPRYETF
ncbi:hypothetical protein OPQ81_001779 [Rhizoctonia solani]|nr:hypothetical protein OPQ81_001779 [Rhizoctonia solani]